jgi:hypothetical protein
MEGMLSRSICCLKSGPQSMMILLLFFSMAMDDRSRLSRRSVDLHTSQLHAITGTPWEVPVPRNVIFIFQPYTTKLCFINTAFDTLFCWPAFITNEIAFWMVQMESLTLQFSLNE